MTESALEMTVELEHDVPVKHEVRYRTKDLPRAEVGGRTIALDLFRRLPFELTRTVTLSEVPFLTATFGLPEQIETILHDTVFPLQNLSTLASSDAAGSVYRTMTSRSLPRRTGDTIQIMTVAHDDTDTMATFSNTSGSSRRDTWLTPESAGGLVTRHRKGILPQNQICYAS